MMHYSALAERNASDTRKMWADAWDAKVIGKREFAHPLWMTEKTIYCITDRLPNIPYTVTDRTTVLLIDCQTLEDARKAFSAVQTNMLSKGWVKQ